jgi:hypothetical protein
MPEAMTDPACSWHDLEFACADGFLMATSAYAAMSLAPSAIPLPPTYEFAGLLLAHPPDAAQHMAASTQQEQHPALSMLHESQIWGLAAYQPTSQTLILAIRGTETIWEWIADFTFAPLPDSTNPANGSVHGGMQLVFEHVRNPIIALVQSKPLKRLRIVAHSLGAAIGTHAALDLMQHGGLPCIPELLTYECPRYGSKAWAGTFSRHISDAIYDRVVNEGDRVPQVPLPPQFWHPGTKQEVYGGWKWTDLAFAHHLSTVQIGLNAVWRAHLEVVAPVIQVP